MDWKWIEAGWPRYGESARRRWGLSQEDTAAIGGVRERLRQLIARRYGVSSSEADRQIADWHSGLIEERDRHATARELEDIEESGSGYCDDETIPESPASTSKR